MLKSVSIAFIFRGLGAISAFLMSVVIAKQLPIDEAGYYFLTFIILNILTPFNLFGTNIASLRFMGSAYAEKNWDEINNIFIGTLSIVLVISLFSASILWLNTFTLSESIWKKPEMNPTLKNAALASIFMSIGALFAHHLLAIQKIVSSIAILSIGVPVGISILVVLFNPQSAVHVTQWLAWVAIVNAASGLLLWIHFNVKVKLIVPDLKLLLATCFPLWIIAIMYTLTQWGSHFIAGVWVTIEEIAYLSIAQRTAMLVSFILIAVNMVTAPRYATLHRQNKHDDIRYLALQSTRMMTGFSFLVILPILFFPERILSLFGSEYVVGSQLLIILSLGQLVNVMTGPAGIILNMSGHEKDMRNIVLVSSSITTMLALFMIPAYGVTGAAIATAVGISSQNLGAVWMVKRRLGFITFAFWKKI